MPELLEPIETDVWSDWLLHRRHGDDSAFGATVQNAVLGYADRVLDGAKIAAGMTMVDVGSGEGLLAFRAIDRIGPSLKVILTDISAPMLRHSAAIAERRQISRQCSYINRSADRLEGIADSTVDVVATRSVLAYVADKRSALREFYRILRPGGRMSVAEPVLQDEALYARVLRARIDAPNTQPIDRFLTLLHRWKAAQYPDTEELYTNSPHVNYSERNLLKFVVDSGFSSVHMELHIDVGLSPVTSWETFINCSPHPWAPSLDDILTKQFSQEERDYFENIIRPGVEAGETVNTERMVYITADKPLS
jgi:arsenite methyltransferase